MLSDSIPGAPYPDNCRACGDMVIRSPVSVVTVKDDNRRAVFGYACERGHRWTYTWALDPIWSHILIGRDARSFRTLMNTADNRRDESSVAITPSASYLMRTACHSLIELWNRQDWQDAATPEERDAVDRAIDLIGTATREIDHRCASTRRPGQGARG